MNIRTRLPDRRVADTFELPASGAVFKITVGYFRPDQCPQWAGGDWCVWPRCSCQHAAPAEVFITGAKAGSDLEAAARDGAILVSLALQHGIPLGTLRAAITREENGKASTIVGAVLDKLASDQFSAVHQTTGAPLP